MSSTNGTGEIFLSTPNDPSASTSSLYPSLPSPPYGSVAMPALTFQAGPRARPGCCLGGSSVVYGGRPQSDSRAGAVAAVNMGNKENRARSSRTGLAQALAKAVLNSDTSKWPQYAAYSAGEHTN